MGSAPLGFELDIWDYVTFVTIFVLVVEGAVLYCWLAGCRAGSRSPANTPRPKRSSSCVGRACCRRSYPWVKASPPLRIGLKSNIQASRLQYMFDVGSSTPSSELRLATGEPRETGFRFHF
jgi:hypothetical protein